jgi:hypothetical protein
MPNPACQVKDGAGAYQATTNGVNVTPANTVTINLIDTSADTWSISCVYTDDLSDAAAVTASLVINTALRTATFTAPVAGRAYIFQSRVNGGNGPDGKAKASYTTTFGVYTLTSDSKRVIAANETTEGGSFGWVASLNAAVRSPGGGTDNGRIPITFADANIDLTGAPHNKTRDTVAGAILSLSGSNATTTRDLTIPRPADDSEAYVLTVEMGVTTNGVRLFHAGGNWTFSPAAGNATHHVMVRNGAITALGPAGNPAQLGVQYVNASGYFAAVPIGTAGQVLAVNGGATGYQWSTAGAGDVTLNGVQTLTNKTINATDNTITDTSTAAGDLLKSNGTKFVRIARGAANTSLRVNSGGTDLVYGLIQNAHVDTAAAIAASKIAGAGSTDEVQTKAATGEITAATNVKAGSGFISFDAGSLATIGAHRFATGSRTLIAFRNAGDTNDITVLHKDASDALFIGTDSAFTGAKQVNSINMYATQGGNIALGFGGATYQYLVSATGVIESWKPRVGATSGTTPFASEGRATQAMADANQTLAASIYSRRIIKFTGALTANRTATFPHPASEDASYEKLIDNTCTGSSLVVSTGTGSTVTMGPSTRAVLGFSPAGVEQFAA